MMSPIQAQAEILRMAGEGMKHQEIADALAARGYIHEKTGKPITPHIVCRILLRHGHRRYAKKRRAARKPTAASSKLKAATKSTAASSKLKAVERILSLTVMPADERIALAQLLIGG